MRRGRTEETKGKRGSRRKKKSRQRMEKSGRNESTRREKSRERVETTRNVGKKEREE